MDTWTREDQLAILEAAAATSWRAIDDIADDGIRWWQDQFVGDLAPDDEGPGTALIAAYATRIHVVTLPAIGHAVWAEAIKDARELTVGWFELQRILGTDQPGQRPSRRQMTLDLFDLCAAYGQRSDRVASARIRQRISSTMCAAVLVLAHEATHPDIC